MQRQPWLSLAPKQQVDTGDQVLELLLGGIAELLVGEQLLISAGSKAFSPSLRLLHQSTHPRASRGDSSATLGAADLSATGPLPRPYRLRFGPLAQGSFKVRPLV